MSSDANNAPATPAPVAARRWRIRPAVPADAPRILELIHELAEYEREPNEVVNTVDQLVADGWGSQPRFFAFMAEFLQELTGDTAAVDDVDVSSLPADGPAVGFALCYVAYSTWKGSCLYLEDLYVVPSARGSGLGMALIARCMREAGERNMARVMFQCLEWNQPSREFYKRINAKEMPAWLSIRYEREGIKEFLQRFPAPDTGVTKPATKGNSA